MVAEIYTNDVFLLVFFDFIRISVLHLFHSFSNALYIIYYTLRTRWCVCARYRIADSTKFLLSTNIERVFNIQMSEKREDKGARNR